MNPTASDRVASPGKYLTIVLGAEIYGITVLKVREIIRLQKITSVPQVPAYVKGVINLRGRVIPIVDLRVRFGLEAAASERNCIVVVEVAGADGRAGQMGLVVDRVEDVANLGAADLAPPPEFGGGVRIECVLAIAKLKGQVVTILDIDGVVASEVVLDSAIAA